MGSGDGLVGAVVEGLGAASSGDAGVVHWTCIVCAVVRVLVPQRSQTSLLHRPRPHRPPLRPHHQHHHPQPSRQPPPQKRHAPNRLRRHPTQPPPPHATTKPNANKAKPTAPPSPPPPAAAATSSSPSSKPKPPTTQNQLDKKTGTPPQFVKSNPHNRSKHPARRPPHRPFNPAYAPKFAANACPSWAPTANRSRSRGKVPTASTSGWVTETWGAIR